MLLYVSQDILHVIVVGLGVVGVGSIAVRSGGELHVHAWLLVGEELGLRVELGRAVRAVGHQVAVREAVVVVVRLAELLVVRTHLVQLRPNLCISISSAHLGAEDLASLRGSSRLALSVELYGLVGDSLVQLVGHVHDELSVWVVLIDSVCIGRTSSGNDFALRCH